MHNIKCLIASKTTLPHLQTFNLIRPLTADFIPLTALLLTFNRIFHSIDQDSSMVFVSLDLSTAFDTIDHSILLNGLHIFYGINGSNHIFSTATSLSPSETLNPSSLFQQTVFHRGPSSGLFFSSSISHPLQQKSLLSIASLNNNMPMTCN